MSVAAIIIFCLVLFFGLIVVVGAPYLPTLTPQIRAAFELLGLQKGETILELGCGDGKVLLLAAKQGYKAVGIELNPVLFLVALWRTRHVRSRVTVRWGNFWTMQWPPSDGVYVFLIDHFMPKLDEKMAVYGGKLASVTFRVPHKKSIHEKNGVFLYKYEKALRK